MPGVIPERDLSLLRQLVRPGILLLLLQQMGELPNINQIAAMLELDRRTVRRYLNELIQMGFITHQSRRNVYVLAEPLMEDQRRVLAYYCRNHTSGVYTAYSRGGA